MTVTSFYARLGTGGWLTLTGYGLAENVHALGSLYKKHQGCLDALIPALIGCEPAIAQIERSDYDQDEKEPCKENEQFAVQKARCYTAN